MELNEATVRHLLTVVDAGLTEGKGEPEPGKMCVEAAICYALGEEHSDRPSCVAEAVRDAKVALNDAPWSDDTARAKGMRRVAIAQLGSKGVVDEQAFAAYLAEQTIRRIVPKALMIAAERHPDAAHKKALEDAASRCEDEGTAAAARSADWAAESAARSAESAVWSAESADWAAESAARSAESAARSAESAARSAESACSADEILTEMATIIEEALVRGGSPGAEWLYLAGGLT